MSVFQLVVIVITSSVFNRVRSLDTLPAVEENDIVKTHAIIKTTTNGIFATFNLRNVQSLPKIKQYSSVYKYFISLTLQDYDSLNEIAKLTRVDKKKIGTTSVDYIALLNEILDEENVIHIKNLMYGEVEGSYNFDDQLDRLQSMKDLYLNPNKVSDINEQILKLLEDDEKANEITAQSTEIHQDNDTRDNDDGLWRPDNITIQTRRIFAGHATRIEHYPFLASVQFFGRFQCGSSIIKSDLAITAASCLQLAWNNRFYRENPAFLSIRVGSSFFENGGETIPIMEVYFYPAYDPPSLKNNLAIMRMVRHVVWNKRVKRIGIDTVDKELPDTVDGIVVVGWGAKTMSNKLQSPFRNKIHYSVLNVYPVEECQEVYSRQYVTRKHFCAGSLTKGSGACNKDVGGPGIVDGYLAGVISFGAPVCGTADAPTVFTKLGFYTDWIEEIMEQEVPQTRKKTTTTGAPTFPGLDIPYFAPNKTSNIIRSEHNLHPIGPEDHKTDPTIVTLIDHNIKNSPTTLWPKKTIKSQISRSRDAKLFKQFLKTMFTSQEIQEYVDSMRDMKVDTPQVMQKIARMSVATARIPMQSRPYPPYAKPLTINANVNRPTSPKLREPVATQIIDFDNPKLKSSDEYVSHESVNRITNLAIEDTTKPDWDSDEVTTSNYFKKKHGTAAFLVAGEDSSTEELSLEISKANDDFASKQSKADAIPPGESDEELVDSILNLVKDPEVSLKPVTVPPLRMKGTINIPGLVDTLPDIKLKQTVKITASDKQAKVNKKDKELWQSDKEPASIFDGDSDTVELAIPVKTTRLDLFDEDMPIPSTLRETAGIFKKNKTRKKKSTTSTTKPVLNKNIFESTNLPATSFNPVENTAIEKHNDPYLKQLRFKKLHRDESQETSSSKKSKPFKHHILRQSKLSIQPPSVQIGRLGPDLNMNDNEKTINNIQEYYRDLLRNADNGADETDGLPMGLEIPAIQITGQVQSSLTSDNANSQSIDLQNGLNTKDVDSIQIPRGDISSQNIYKEIDTFQIPRGYPTETLFQSQTETVTETKPFILVTKEPLFIESNNAAILQKLNLENFSRNEKNVTSPSTVKTTSEDYSDDTYMSNYDLIVKRPRRVFGKSFFFMDLIV